MEPELIPQLIAEIALADPRIRRNDEIEQVAQIGMWAGILADVPYDDAIRFVHEHYATSQWPILPANIATRWQATVRDRMDRHTGTFEPTTHPELDPDDIAGYQTALRAERHAVATGATAPVELRELTAGPDAEVERRLQQLGDYVPRHVRDLLAEHRPRRAERERLAHAGLPDPLNVTCDWCGAQEGQPCRSRRRHPKTNAVANRPRRSPHPSRIDTARDHT